MPGVDDERAPDGPRELEVDGSGSSEGRSSAPAGPASSPAIPVGPDGNFIEEFADDDEVWFTAEALAAASHVELDNGGPEDPLLRPPRTIDELESSAGDVGIDWSVLPGWTRDGTRDGEPTSLAGIGRDLGEMLGTLRSGFVGLWTGAPGSGVSAWLAQLADGLALREDVPLTPVAWCAQRGRSDALSRTVARHLGVERRLLFTDPSTDGAPWAAARAALGSGRELGSLADRQRFVRWSDAPRGRELALALATGIPRWLATRPELNPDGQTGSRPVIVIDDLRSWAGDDSIALMLETLTGAVRRAGMIVLAGATGDVDLEAARPFVDVIIEVERDRAVVRHNRRGPRGAVEWTLEPASGRVTVGARVGDDT